MDDTGRLALIRALEDLIGPALDRSPEWRALANAAGAWLLEQARAAEARAEATAPLGEPLPEPGVSDAGQAPASGVPASSESAPASAGTRDPEFAEPDRPASAPPAPAAIPKAPWTIADVIADAGARPSPAAGDSEWLTAGTGRVYGQSGEPESAVADARPFLPLLVERCRLKAEACRVYIERRAAMHDPVREPPLVDRIDAMLERARALPECFLWVLYRAREQPADATLRLIADCYDALADAGELLEMLEELEPRTTRPAWLQAFGLMAEAVSALRVALRRSWLTGPDADQYAAFDWLHDAIARRDIHLSRYLRRGDDADPQRAPEISAAARAGRAALEADVAAAARRRGAIRQLRYHAEQVDREPPAFVGHHLRRLADLLEPMADAEVAAADLRRLADVLPAGIAARLRPIATPAVQSLLDRLPRDDDRAAPDAEAWQADEDDAPRSDRVLAVRDLLAGRQVVFVGGQPREDAARRLERAFDLSALCWVRLTEHGSGEPLRAPIQRPETALVIGLAKLGGHLHLDQAHALARAAGKPFVILPAGYNPEQVAAAVLEQASRQLQAG